MEGSFFYHIICRKRLHLSHRNIFLMKYHTLHEYGKFADSLATILEIVFPEDEAADSQDSSLDSSLLSSWFQQDESVYATSLRFCESVSVCVCVKNCDDDDDG